MASIALDPAYRRVSVDEFLAMDFAGAKAELEDGLIYMMAGGTAAHARVAANLIVSLGIALRGSRCMPFGSDFAMRTGERTIRFPDVSVFCNNPGAPENDRKQLLGDPKVVFEVLSPSTADHDQRVKVLEYRARAGVCEIILVDPDTERVRRVGRIGLSGWSDDWLEPEHDLALPSLGITIPHTEIFARD